MRLEKNRNLVNKYTFMKIRNCLIAVLMLLIYSGANAQDTFSIIAVDSVTGEVGSAGASCVGYIIPTYPHGAQIISYVLPGTGAIHTQAAWDATNQQNATTRMLAGDSPAQIISFVTLNDAGGNSSTRQYGVVDLNSGHPRSAGFTGVNCINYKNHITGPGYSIQGNILFGQQVLDSIETRFLNTPGSLAVKLMSALQGAKILGADTRCASHNTSSLSSFIRVAQTGDTAGNFYLDLYMAYPNGIIGALAVDPIDSLQTLFDTWQTSTSVESPTSNLAPVVMVYQDSNGHPVFDFNMFQHIEAFKITLFDLAGKKVMEEEIRNKTFVLDRNERKLAEGAYVYHVHHGLTLLSTGKVIL